jgi:hypothetical protein
VASTLKVNPAAMGTKVAAVVAVVVAVAAASVTTAAIAAPAPRASRAAARSKQPGDRRLKTGDQGTKFLGLFLFVFPLRHLVLA